MRAGIFQTDMAEMTPGQRIERLRNVAAAADADLIVCPELFLSGYASRDDVNRYAEASDGSWARQIAQIARETRTAITYGYPEAADGVYYNAAQCFDADGEKLANHRKLVLPPGFETGLLTPGCGLTLFDLGELRFGLLICYDAEFPEAVRATAEAGAQVVIVPTALGDQWSVVANRVIPTRAFENGVYLLYANHAGAEGDVTYLGQSCIIGPDGQDVARAGSAEEFISALLDPARVTAAQDRLPYLRDVRFLRTRTA